MSYAENTSVPVERSRAEIETTLKRYGADKFVSGWDEKTAFVAFRAKDRFVRFVLPLPDAKDKRFAKDARSSYKTVSTSVSLQRWEQACRSRWRALVLCIKAKLESVDAGIETFDQAFLAHVVLPDNTLVGDHVIAAIQSAYATGKVPALMPHEGD